ALLVSFAGKLYSVPLPRRSNDVYLHPLLAQARKCWPREFRGAAATGGGVHDGEKSVHGGANKSELLISAHQKICNRLHKGRIADALSSFARRSASTLRLILREAVRGKSSSSRTTP